MRVSLIAAMTRQRVIGQGNRMPWHLPADLKHFKQLTLHKPVVMGRKTYESIGHALPKRRNMVLSSNKNLQLADAQVYTSLQDILDQLTAEPEVMIIGGQTLFDKTLPLADTLYLTLIDADIAGDTFFPEFRTQDWQLTDEETHKADVSNPYPYRFLTYCRT